MVWSTPVPHISVLRPRAYRALAVRNQTPH